MDSKLVSLARGANLWILDAEFTTQEWQDRQGWGHSSLLEAPVNGGRNYNGPKVAKSLVG